MKHIVFMAAPEKNTLKQMPGRKPTTMMQSVIEYLS
jgi:hypothetical protein